MKSKSITFDKAAQDALPQHIKDKMKADREKAKQITPTKNKAEEIVNKFLNMPTCESVKAAVYAASYMVNEIIPLLPDINQTPPIHRMPENQYKQYWMGVDKHIDNYR